MYMAIHLMQVDCHISCNSQEVIPKLIARIVVGFVAMYGEGIHSFHLIRRTKVQNHVIITCHNNRRVQTNGMKIASQVGEHRGP